MARNLMIQGTMSGAGKSILTAGILRLLTQDGYRCAPFKSQNMALNSFVTADGREMGRAQVVQAAAARLAPSADMNPILLKPMGDTTSQVILNGRPVGNYKARDYFAHKKELVPDILAAYRRLEEQAEVIVIEGAGSPVEINLRENDIVNMGLAELVDAPVLLAGNIDPGGVFAQLLGTIELLQPKERERVKGLIINKFRGDPKILEPGLEMFRAYCEIPFAGVVPYVPLDLDEEDSLSEKLRNSSGRKEELLGERGDILGDEKRLRGRPSGCPAENSSTDNGSAAGSGMRGRSLHRVDVAVIRLPMISNYTDFTALSHTEGISLRYVGKEEKLDDPDLVILPGSKNTTADLEWLWECGLAEGILGAAAKGTPVIGICGGYQMLGESVMDPERMEGGGQIRGLGLLPIRTIFGREKITRQSSARILDLPGIWEPMSGLTVQGYEIHMGESCVVDMAGWSAAGIHAAKNAGAGQPFMERVCGRVSAEEQSSGEGSDRKAAAKGQSAFAGSARMDGCVAGNALGTYLHGFFDAPSVRQALVRILFARRGWTAPVIAAESAWEYQDRQLDRLADVLRESLNLKLLYDTIGL